MKSYTQPVTIWTFTPALFGPVRPDVARVSMRLSDGAVLNLYPVEAYGHSWIGLVLPEGLWPDSRPSHRPWGSGASTTQVAVGCQAV